MDENVNIFDFKRVDGRRIYYINGRRIDKKTFFEQLALHRHEMRKTLRETNELFKEMRERLERLGDVEECLVGAVKDLSKRSKVLNRTWRKVNRLSWP